MARSGYTLPVFAVAAAVAALQRLLADSEGSIESVDLDLLSDRACIPIQQVARLSPDCALGITVSDPGDNLDLTRDMPVWAQVQLVPRLDRALILEAGEGVGRTALGDAAIYRYATQLFETNLGPLIPATASAIVQIILPLGRALAKRTSNAAFGVLEGLSLLGTSGIAQPHTATDYLEQCRSDLQAKAPTQPKLVFCIGSNGQQVADRLGLPPESIVRTGNWLGAMLVEAGLLGVQSVLLLGYHGKLVKLAGGIFNTSSHLADAKLEIISAAVAQSGGDLAAIQAVLAASTAEAAYQQLAECGLSDRVFALLADKIQHQAQRYVSKYANVHLQVGVTLFDRGGQIVAQNSIAQIIVHQITAHVSI